MPYLNMDLDYFEHRKTKRLIGLLGRGAEVLPIRLWSYCGKFHCENGRLTGYSEQEIESLATWWGKTGIMLPAMKTSEFMDMDAVGWFMHEWLEHQGHLVAFKAKGKAMADARWKKARDAASNAASMLQAMPTKEVGSVGTVGVGKGLEGAGRKGFPVTVDDALAQCSIAAGAVPKEYVMHCFDRAEYRNGCDDKEIPISNFAAYVRTQWKYEQDRIGRERVGQTAGGKFGSGPRENPRNVGIVKGPTDYAAAAQRKAEGRGQTPMAGPLAKTEGTPSTTESPGGRGL